MSGSHRKCCVLSLVNSFSSRDSEEIFDSSMNLTITEKCLFEPKITSQLGEEYSPIALISMSTVMLSYGISWMM